MVVLLVMIHEFYCTNTREYTTIPSCRGKLVFDLSRLQEGIFGYTLVKMYNKANISQTLRYSREKQAPFTPPPCDFCILFCFKCYFVCFYIYRRQKNCFRTYRKHLKKSLYFKKKCTNTNVQGSGVKGQGGLIFLY